MLVLTRKASEAIKIDGPATITILSTNGNRIKIGIDAPRDVKVLRGELLDREREAAPLKPAEDAVLVDTSEMDIEAAVAMAVAAVDAVFEGK